LPLRRDIIKNVFDYWNDKDRYILKKTKDFGDVAGSGKKPFPQKGRGASRQGNKRAPQRKGGGVTHGPVPRCLGFPINNKLRLLALKTMLSAKLYEDKLIFIDSEAIEYPKTTLLEAIVKPYGLDKLCFVTPT
jgi:large subunit ribosomal protein L4